MATSGSINFLVTRDEIITEALELIGVLGEGESPNQAQLDSCSRTLNMLVKNWQADGLNLFSVVKQYLFLENGVSEYGLSSSSTDHFTEVVKETTVSSAANFGEYILPVENAIGFLTGDNIWVQGPEYGAWTFVDTIASETEIVLASPLEFNVEEGYVVRGYVAKGTRPLQIIEATLHRLHSNTDIPLKALSRREYIELSNKSVTGTPLQFYYDPQISEGKLHVWPAPTSGIDYITLYVTRTLEDLDAGTDNPDFPQEWYMPLAYCLAMYLAPKYGMPQNDYYILARQATELYERAKYFDVETGTSVYFQPGEE